jgi:hypothetical protein
MKHVYFFKKKGLKLALLGFFGVFYSLKAMQVEQNQLSHYPDPGKALGLMVTGKPGQATIKDVTDYRDQNVNINSTTSPEHGNVKLDGWTLLHASVYDGNRVIIEYLLNLEPKPDMTIKTDSKKTPLELGILAHKNASQEQKSHIKTCLKALLSKYDWANPTLRKGFEIAKKDLTEMIGIDIAGYENRATSAQLKYTLEKLKAKLVPLSVLLKKLTVTT